MRSVIVSGCRLPAAGCGEGVSGPTGGHRTPTAIRRRSGFPARWSLSRCRLLRKLARVAADAISICCQETEGFRRFGASWVRAVTLPVNAPVEASANAPCPP